MKLKSLLSAFCLTFAVLGVYAVEDAGHYLHIQTSNGWSVLDLNTVDRLSFASGTMTATDKDQKVVGSYPQTSLTSMYVDDNEDLAGVRDVIADSQADAVFRYNSSNSEAAMLADGEFAVYSVDGCRLVYIPEAKSGDTIDLSAISEKIVILKSGKYTLKTVRK